MKNSDSYVATPSITVCDYFRFYSKDSFGIKGYVNALRITNGVAVYSGTDTSAEWSNFSEITAKFPTAATITTTTSSTTPIVPAVPAKDPKFGSGMGEFDGDGDSLTIPTHGDFTLGTGDYTIEGWVKGDTEETTATSTLTVTAETVADTHWDDVVFLVTGDETVSGSTFTSSDSTGHTCTLVGDAAKTTSSGGKFGEAFTFDGTGDYITIPAHADWAFGTVGTCLLYTSPSPPDRKKAGMPSCA